MFCIIKLAILRKYGRTNLGCAQNAGRRVAATALRMAQNAVGKGTKCSWEGQKMQLRRGVRVVQSHANECHVSESVSLRKHLHRPGGVRVRLESAAAGGKTSRETETAAASPALRLLLRIYRTPSW